MTPPHLDPTIVVVMSHDLRSRLFTTQTWTRLTEAGDVRVVTDPTPSVDLATALADAVVCVTGWDSPPLPPELFGEATASLGLVAHTGGSVRWLVPAAAFDHGVRVTQASAVLAEAVAEFTVMSIIAGLRDAVSFASAMRDGHPWEQLAARAPGRLLRDQVVGIIGASRTGRATVHRLKPFGCRILLADPYLPQGESQKLGVEKVALDDLVQLSDVISLHAPVLPETTGMLGADQIAAMRPGALVVNTARSALVDSSALLDAARQGRLRLMTDVFDDEPLPADSPWRSCDGVVSTPHIAALTRETLYEQGSATVDDVVGYLTGVPLRHEVTREAFHINA